MKAFTNVNARDIAHAVTVVSKARQEKQSTEDEEGPQKRPSGSSAR